MLPGNHRRGVAMGVDILFSRLIRLDAMGGELALVPWADMLNHKPGCAAFIDERRQRQSHHRSGVQQG